MMPKPKRPELATIIGVAILMMLAFFVALFIHGIMTSTDL